MFKFFRIIRRQLLTENKFSKYLLYAIGEIVLVVIGIMIAVQFNNWNNERAERKKELVLLSEIKRNLEANINHFGSEIKRQDSIVKNIDTIIEQIKNNIPYHDSLGVKYASISWTEEFNTANSAFETLKTLGFDIITSESLRENIINLFNVKYIQISDVVSKVSNTEHIQLDALYLRHIEWDKQGRGIVNDFEKLRKDKEFTNMLSGRRLWKVDLLRTYKDLSAESQKLANQINEEVQSRK